MVYKDCQHCGESFKTWQCRIDIGQGKFCSRACGMAFRTKTPKEIFFKNVMIGDIGLCWPYKVLHKTGYGILYVNRKLMFSHRFSYMLNFGNIPPGMLVLHKCDNRKCCNPAHLFLGTTLDNSNDKVNKKRQARGKTSGMVKYTEEQIRRVKQKLKDKISTAQIALEENVHKSTVEHIKYGRTWKHLEV